MNSCPLRQLGATAPARGDARWMLGGSRRPTRYRSQDRPDLRMPSIRKAASNHSYNRQHDLVRFLVQQKRIGVSTSRIPTECRRSLRPHRTLDRSSDSTSRSAHRGRTLREAGEPAQVGEPDHGVDGLAHPAPDLAYKNSATGLATDIMMASSMANNTTQRDDSTASFRSVIHL
jgi:hypothetical protein